MINVAQFLAAWCAANGVRNIYGVSGGRILPLINACAARSDIDFIHARHEGGAAFMADASARISGMKIGVCASTSGPGATNLVSGVAGAYADSVPVLAITGQAERTEIGKGGIQEGSGICRSPDVSALFAPITKRTLRLEEPNQLPAILDELLEVATSGRRGPVHLDIPYDLFAQNVGNKTYKPAASPRLQVVTPTAQKLELTRLFERFETAAFPVLFLGQGVKDHNQDEIEALADFGIAVTTTLGAKGLLDEAHPMSLGMSGCYGQEVAANYLLQQADLIVMLGTSLQYLSTIGWNARFDAADVVHIDLDPNELEKACPKLRTRILGDGSEILTALASRFAETNITWQKGRSEVDRLKAELGFYPSNINSPGQTLYQDVHPSQLMSLLSELAKGKMIVLDSGENAYWAMLSLKSNSRNLFANYFWGAMGYAIPAAIGHALNTNERAIAIVGDGGLLMSGLELSTAADYNAPITVCVLNNGIYGTQYHWQLAHGRNEAYSTTIDNFQVAPFSQAFGVRHYEVHDIEELTAALSDLAATSGVQVINIYIDRLLKPHQVSQSTLVK